MKDMWADLVAFSPVRINLSLVASRDTSSQNLKRQVKAFCSATTPSSLRVKFKMAIVANRSVTAAVKLQWCGKVAISPRNCRIGLMSKATRTTAE